MTLFVAYVIFHSYTNGVKTYSYILKKFLWRST
nr:MAG TPA: hypothetical protein [Caudoviricetes sp.]